MGLEDAEALVRGGRAEGAGERVGEADGGVVGRAELEVVGALGDPGGVLEDAAEAGDEGVLRRAWSGGRRWAGPGGGLRQWAAMSARVAIQTSGLAWMWARKSARPLMRPGRPTRRQWRPTDIIFGRAGLAFGVEDVEGVAEVGEEVLGGVEGAGREAHVVGFEAVGDDELLAAAVLAPVGEVVVVGVGDPVEAAGLGDEVDGLDRGAAGVPAARGLRR